MKAINTKKSAYGPIKLIKGTVWVSQSRVSYNCQWLHTVTRVFTKISIFTYMGELVDTNPVIHQDVTNSICNYKYRFCRPVERTKSILTWNYRPLSINVFHGLGFFNVTKIDNYILIAKLGIGGSIIRNVSGTYLLDVGYVVSRINIRNMAKVSRRNKNRDLYTARQDFYELHKPQNKSFKVHVLERFYNFSRKYVEKTKSNVQRSLDEGRLTSEIILLNEMIRTLANLQCQLWDISRNYSNFCYIILRILDPIFYLGKMGGMLLKY